MRQPSFPRLAIARDIIEGEATEVEEDRAPVFRSSRAGSGAALTTGAVGAGSGGEAGAYCSQDRCLRPDLACTCFAGLDSANCTDLVTGGTCVLSAGPFPDTEVGALCTTGVLLQAGNALCAASMAAEISSAEQRGISATASPVAGLTTKYAWAETAGAPACAGVAKTSAAAATASRRSLTSLKASRRVCAGRAGARSGRRRD